MIGMSNTTGKTINELAHIRQSVKDILTTPIGSRIQRRDYGSLLPELIDHPHNEANNLRLRAATVMAIAKWEPRISITNITSSLNINGETSIELTGLRIDQYGNQDTVQMNIGGLR